MRHPKGALLTQEQMQASRHRHKVERYKNMSAEDLRHEAACILEAAAIPTELVETLLQPEVGP